MVTGLKLALSRAAVVGILWARRAKRAVVGILLLWAHRVKNRKAQRKEKSLVLGREGQQLYGKLEEWISP